VGGAVLRIRDHLLGHTADVMCLQEEVNHYDVTTCSQAAGFDMEASFLNPRAYSSRFCSDGECDLLAPGTIRGGARAKGAFARIRDPLTPDVLCMTGHSMHLTVQ
jgi:hypothetical protein